MPYLPTFKEELRRYPWPPSSAIKQHRDRWLEHGDTQEIWDKVSKGAGANLTAGEFIQFVVRARCAAAGLPARIKSSANHRAFVIECRKPRIKKALASKNTLSEIAQVLEDAAFEMCQIERSSEDLFEGYPSAAFSRKDQKGSQARRAFCLIVGRFLSERCGSWMDDQVASLVDVALPRTEVTSPDDVKAMRRSRIQEAMH